VLVSGASVGQAFRADADGLARIDVCVAAPAGTMPALMLHLASRPPARHADGTVAASPADADVELRRARVAAGAVAEDAWIAAEFDPLDACAGRSLYFWVELADEGAAAGAPAAAPVALRTYAEGWGEAPPSGLHLDHRPVAGSLAFRTFHVRGAAVTPRAGSRSPSPSPP
jgi:hypothetical protein